MGRRSAAVLRFVGVGWYIATCVVLGAFGGRWVGQQLGGSASEAIFMIVGVLLGVLIAFYGVYQMVKLLESESSDSNRSNG